MEIAASRASRATSSRPCSALRHAVNKWFAHDARHPLRVSSFGHTRVGNVPYVRVERAAAELSLFFFRHEDGSWNVFPPAA
jgi:hypothetical protein